MTKTKNRLTNNLCTSSDLTELSRIRDFVLEKATGFGFRDADAQRIALAVDEACTNLIKHAYREDNNRKICVKIDAKSNEFNVYVLDDGAPFNPTDVDAPDMKEYFEKFKRGGLGIHIMRQVMDNIAYTPSDAKNPRNTLKLTKILA